LLLARVGGTIRNEGAGRLQPCKRPDLLGPFGDLLGQTFWGQTNPHPCELKDLT
jgi:hypothetical protein